jgi:integrase
MIPSRSVTEVVGRWRSHMVPPAAADFARQMVARAAPSSPARAKALLFAASRAGSFAVMAGLELRAEVVFCPAVIERFIVVNARVFSGPTARTLRTNCRSLGRALAAYPEPAPVPLPRERAKKPYTVEEISAYLALADAQPTPARALRTGAVICLGAGTGLVGADLAGVRGSDVVCRSGGVLVEVGGRRPRAVPVLSRYHSRLVASAGSAGTGYLIGGTEASRRNVASALLASLSGGSDLPRLEQARLRATWLYELAGRLGLQAFMAAAGVDCSQRLGDIVSTLAPLAETQAVALLGGRS